MSASRRPTRAPDSWSGAARLSATVDLPTPRLPDPAAMTWLTPGMAVSWPWPLTAARTLAVIFTSTAVTPDMSDTSCLASVWKRSRTGHAGVVSSNVKLTWPAWSIARSLIMPRLTTSRPRSGSLIAERTSRTSSLLGTEDHRRPHREHTKQDQDGDDDRVDMHSGGGRGRSSSGAQPPHAPARRDQRRGHARDGDRPQRQPQELAVERSRDRERSEENDDQRELEHPEVAVGLVQPAEAEARRCVVADEQCDQRGRAAEAGGQEQAEKRADDANEASDHGGKQESTPRPAEPGVGRRDEGEEPEHEQRPRAGRHRRPVVEDRSRLAGRDVDQHVPEPRPARRQVRGQQDRTDDEHGQGDEVAGACRRLVTNVAGKPQQRRDHIGTSGQTGEDEVEEDVPEPL